MTGMPASYFCIKAFSETDMTEDLRKIGVPTLILHGDDDQIVPIADFGNDLGKAGEKCRAEDLPRRSARHVHDREGQGQSGSTCLHPTQGNAVASLMLLPVGCGAPFKAPSMVLRAESTEGLLRIEDPKIREKRRGGHFGSLHLPNARLRSWFST